MEFLSVTEMRTMMVFWEDQRVNSNGLADINPEDIETLSILKVPLLGFVWF